MVHQGFQDAPRLAAYVSLFSITILTPCLGRRVKTGQGSISCPSTKLQAESLRDRRKHEHRFHHRKRVAYASARASAEREVGILRQFLNLLVHPSFGAKLFRVVKVSGVAVHYPGEEKQLPPLSYVVAADLAILYSLPPESPRGRVEPHRLFYDRVCVFQLRQVFRPGALPPRTDSSSAASRASASGFWRADTTSTTG